MKKHLLWAVMGLAAAGMASCSSDEPAPKGNGVAEGKEVRYIRVAISNPQTGSRVDNTNEFFENGTEAENKVSSMLLKFYDAAGNQIKSDNTNTEVTFVDATTETGAPSVGKIKEAVIEIQLNKGAAYPSYVVAFLNPVNYSQLETEDGKKMDQLRGLLRSDFKSAEKDFTMTNSAYYGSNPITGATNVKMSGAPILADQLFKTKAEAEAAKDGHIVNIYVERLASKVQFYLNKAGIEDFKFDDDNPYALTFVPEVWTINADETQTYSIKRFDNTDANNDVIPTFAEVNDMLGGWTTWNDPALHRSYWGCSPSYYSKDYPQVSDDIIDQVAGDGLIGGVVGSQNGAGVTVGDYKLRYYSYNQITNPDAPYYMKGIFAFEANGEGQFPCKYVMENTMGMEAYKSVNPYAAAPSVLLIGHYELKYNGAKVTAPAGFCVYNNIVYYKDLTSTGNENLPGNAKSIVDAMLDANQVLMNAAGELYKSNNISPELKALFEVVHPDKEIRGAQAVPHRYVTLQIKHQAENGTDAEVAAFRELLSNFYYSEAGSQNPVQATANTNLSVHEILNNLNTLLWQQLGIAHSYTNNMCYFSIPIQHLGITENTVATSPIDADGSIDWAKARRGDFGLVRNHVYTIKVEGITGLAHGIDDPDNPIVPSTPQDSYFVKYRINILNWRIVPVQGNIVLK